MARLQLNVAHVRINARFTCLTYRENMLWKMVEIIFLRFLNYVHPTVQEKKIPLGAPHTKVSMPLMKQQNGSGVVTPPGQNRCTLFCYSVIEPVLNL